MGWDMKPLARGKKSGGFTLIELMVVLAIIALIILFVAPRIDYQHYQIDGGMQAVATALMGAQREAVAKQHDVVVMFDQPNRSLRILLDEDNDATPDANERVRVVALDDQVRFGRALATPLSLVGAGTISFTQVVSGMRSVTFHRNGSASEAGGLYLTSARAATGSTRGQRDTRALALYRATGRPEWWTYDGSAWHRGF